ncbi:MAG TPA: BTAD domain-containing putative transcriptional regulator [Pilimelia sp.]|nr:BTAD domain-containing putative transcriptional regulator [Pilimelia sp.]
MRLRVLGTLELFADGEADAGASAVPLRSPKLRRLLAALAVRTGSVVSVDRLADVVWGDEPPANAEAALHTLVFRLRAALGQDDGLAVLTRAPGYVLDAGQARVDAAEFEELVVRARTRAPADPRHSAALLDEALALWRGPAYAEFADEDFARAEAGRLEELRVTAAEDRVEAALALGRPEDAVVRLEPLVVEHPLRERPHAQLVLALYRGGRHADALRVYRDYRERLDDELGLAPSAALRRLEADVLRQAPGLAQPATEAQPAEPPVPARPGRGLPVSPLPLIGRAEAVSTLRELVRTARVVTLIGPGGVGKTSLAVQVATGAASTYPDGGWLVELATVSDPEAVGHAVSSALSVQQRHGTSVLDRLVEYLRPKRLLLVIDNCEHVVEAAAALVDAVVAGCPAVTILATSREPLGVGGEQVRPVAPLPIPTSAAVTAADVITAPSVELFVARAAAVAGEFVVTEANAGAVAEICRRLDGLPLAIELAASRMRSTSPAELVGRLDARLHVLRSSRRLAAGRHRTLRAVVDWSYALLSPDERLAFDLLSVFAGGFRLAAAEAVVAGCGPGADITGTDVADVIEGLVDKSMVVASPGADPDGSTRYRLLETLRAYGRERLDERGLAEPGRRAHAEHYARFLEDTAPRLRGSDVVAAADAIAREIDELRAVHGWALAADLHLASRLVAALVDYVELRMPAEIFQWADQTVATAGETADPVVLTVAGSGARFRGDLARAEALAQRALSAVPASDPRRCFPLFLSLEVALFQGRQDESERLAAELEPLAVSSGDGLRASFALLTRALIRAYTGDLAAAADEAARSRRWAARTGSPMAIAWARYVEGEVCLDSDPDRAVGLLDEALSDARTIGDRYLTGVVLVSLASLRARYGDLASARPTFQEAIAHWHQAGDWTHQWTTLRNVVDLLLRTHADEPAAVLLGAVTSRATSARVYGADADRLDEARRTLLHRLGPQRLAAATTRGQAMNDDEVVDWAGTILSRWPPPVGLRA